MNDFTEVIGRMSEVFQANDMVVMDVIPLVGEVMWSLSAMQLSPGSSVSSLTRGDMYKGVHLSGEVKLELSTQQISFVDSAIKHMDERFYALQKPPFSDFEVFNFNIWPCKKEQAAKFSVYGRDQFGRLIEQFATVLSENEVAEATKQWMAFELYE